MKFVIDHDLHIHSHLSICSSNPKQTKERILAYAKQNHLKNICLTDHYWDETICSFPEWHFYHTQTTPHIKESLPLPQDEGVNFYFGCETDLDKDLTLGITEERCREMDFIIIPTNHLHMYGFTIEEKDYGLDRRREVFIERLHNVLDRNLPFEKIGIAHFTCSCTAPGDWENHLTLYDAISDETYEQVFKKIAAKGAGVELNFTPAQYTQEDLPRILRPYFIAKDCGCKFYLGSDAHHPENLDAAMKQFEDIVDCLKLEESDKFNPFK